VVGREDEVGCVACRATWVGQRTLVDLNHVGPTQLGKVTDEAIAYDSGTDYDALCTGWKLTHLETPKIGYMNEICSISPQYHGQKIG
jgi:hypothetical protein